MRGTSGLSDHVGGLRHDTEHGGLEADASITADAGLDEGTLRGTEGRDHYVVFPRATGALPATGGQQRANLRRAAEAKPPASGSHESAGPSRKWQKCLFDRETTDGPSPPSVVPPEGIVWPPQPRAKPKESAIVASASLTSFRVLRHRLAFKSGFDRSLITQGDTRSPKTSSC
jgi:hypothetical protein